MSGISISKSLEYALLRPSTTYDDVRSGCELAQRYHLAAVCVYPVHVSTAVEVLQGTDTRVCAAIGFPFGQETMPAKLVAIEQAQSDGAHEMAMMLDHSALVSGDVTGACREIERICAAAFWSSLITTRGRAELTIVLETALYDCGQLQRLWDMLDDSPVGFVQTSSGYQARAVTEDHVRMLRSLLPEHVAIKAVGGIHSFADAAGLLASGAVRVGTGSAVVIAQEERQDRPQPQVKTS